MGIMDGIRVVEVAAWTYVPAAGAVLAEWGADVIRSSIPETGDPQRGLVTLGPGPDRARRGQPHDRAAQPGQAQRGLDLRHARRPRPAAEAGGHGGRVPHQLPAPRPGPPSGSTSRTSGPPTPTSSTCAVAARASAARRRTAAATTAARSGAGGWPTWHALGSRVAPISPARAGVRRPDRRTHDRRRDLGRPVPPRAHRRGARRRQLPPGTAMWATGASVLAAGLFGLSTMPKRDRTNVPNPIVNIYRTADGRFLSLIMLHPTATGPSWSPGRAVPSWPPTPVSSTPPARAETPRGLRRHSRRSLRQEDIRGVEVES